MSALSLRRSLLQIGEGKPGRAIPSWPSGFHSTPSSLRRAQLAMRPPRIAEWLHLWSESFENKNWTEECQGVATDGAHWYFATNSSDRRGVFKSASGGKARFVEIKGTEHVGALGLFEGRLYVALDRRRVAILDTYPRIERIVQLGPGGVSDGIPWCAVNPWNRCLYTSRSDDSARIHAYDIDRNFAYVGALSLSKPIPYGVQAGCMTANGHLYLCSDAYISERATKQILAYSTFNGAYLGACDVPYDEDALDAEEMEGFAVFPMGASGHVHVVILDNDWPSQDDVFVRHLFAPDPEVL